MLLCSTSCLKTDIPPILISKDSGLAGEGFIYFSGYRWKVKNSPRIKIGPGPNFWSQRNVWVDAQGRLHLRLAKYGNNWYCAEVQSVDSFGLGTWQWKVEGAIDLLDKNLVLGLFNYSGNDGFDEMDIEFARWGKLTNPNLNYTVWPAQSGFSNFSFSQEFSLHGTYTTHRFTRTGNSVTFKSLNGFYDDDTNLFATGTCTNPPNSINVLKMPAYMNLWMFKGKLPSDAKALDIVVHEFSYRPL
jgi:hypothetical protein